jgi:class 3 adenylate cyclase
MIDDARIEAGAAAYRGFLFSDLRGFTAFAERYGNTAAAAKVNRFLDIARRAIARHEGAEIKTEGDAIHAVFPSASGAVLCGMEIADATEELNAEEPHRPLGMGVGVHAGEAVETAEGYIGRAVNIAARLCAAAKPGEVLVSSTVKGITQASIPVGFIPRGRRRLKGIQDPILVYSVTRDMTARAPRTVPRPVVYGAAGIAVAVVAAIAIVAGSQFLANPAAKDGASPSALAAPTARPVVIGPLPVGTYVSTEFQPPVTFRIGDQDWTANRDAPDLLGLLRLDAPRGSVHFLRVVEVIDNPCIQGSDGTHTGLGADEVVARLRKLTHLTLSDPKTILVDGYPGQEIDVSVSDAALATCGGLAGGEASIFLAGKEVWGAASGERFRLITVSVRGQAVTILLSTDWTQTPSVQELENLYELGQRVVDSVKF